jgi:hypothetical protein
MRLRLLAVPVSLVLAMAASAPAALERSPLKVPIVERSSADGLSEVADSVTGSSDPTYFATNHRVAVTAGGRQLVIYGRHATGVQLVWRDPGRRVWRQATRREVSDGVLLGGTGTGDWSASIAVARDGAGEEHAWVVWSAAATGGTSKALQMRRLSSLDAPGGPVVGPILTLDAAASGPARPDLAFERAPDGSFRGCVVWTRLFSASRYELVAAWFTDLSTDRPALHDSASLITNVSASRNPTLTPSPGGLRVAARSSSDRLQLYAHDAATPLASWSASLAGVSMRSGSVPSAAGLASGAVLAVVEGDTTAHAVTVQRFASGGAVSSELQLSGYSMPTIATDGENAWLVMIRLGDGYVVSRSFSAALGWSPDDRVEVGVEGGGGYSWPNLLREADGRLRFIVRGTSGATQRSAVLSFQRRL